MNCLQCLHDVESVAITDSLLRMCSSNMIHSDYSVLNDQVSIRFFDIWTQYTQYLDMLSYKSKFRVGALKLPSCLQDWTVEFLDDEVRDVGDRPNIVKTGLYDTYKVIQADLELSSTLRASSRCIFISFIVDLAFTQEIAMDG